MISFLMTTIFWVQNGSKLFNDLGHVSCPVGGFGACFSQAPRIGWNNRRRCALNSVFSGWLPSAAPPRRAGLFKKRPEAKSCAARGSWICFEIIFLLLLSQMREETRRICRHRPWRGPAVGIDLKGICFAKAVSLGDNLRPPPASPLEAGANKCS